MSVLFKTPWPTPDIEAVKSLTFMHCVIYGSLQVGHNSRHLNTEWLMVLHWKLTRRVTAFLNAALWMEGKPMIMNQQYCQPGDGSFLPEKFYAALKGTWILCLQSVALHSGTIIFFFYMTVSDGCVSKGINKRMPRTILQHLLLQKDNQLFVLLLTTTGSLVVTKSTKVVSTCINILTELDHREEQYMCSESNISPK